LDPLIATRKGKPVRQRERVTIHGDQGRTCVAAITISILIKAQQGSEINQDILEHHNIIKIIFLFIQVILLAGCDEFWRV
jgi:hypothetical protein